MRMGQIMLVVVWLALCAGCASAPDAPPVDPADTGDDWPVFHEPVKEKSA